MNAGRGTLRSLSAVRTAAATSVSLRAYSNRYPSFVHKWTKERRHYTPEDLRLPPEVFASGIWPDWDRPVVGVGGSRTPTVETFCLVANVVRELSSAGATIVSGGVPGVDLAAHLSALDSRYGTTIAVLANPVELGLRGHEWSSDIVEGGILKHGGFISEYRSQCEVFSQEYCERLLARDRIISGLCDIFVAFECNEGSATVDTTRRAFVQGKDVICIESAGRSTRRGLYELEADLPVAFFSERRLSVAEIVSQLKQTLARPRGEIAAANFI
jgi:predicted Rossmann fold nucleotide-binding protein DprA/Smf involved in DNA uptake